jgi:hypothetical protein
MPTSVEVDTALELATGQDPANASTWIDRDRLVLAEEVRRLRSYGVQFAKVEAELRAEIALLRKASE